DSAAICSPVRASSSTGATFARKVATFGSTGFGGAGVVGAVVGTDVGVAVGVGVGVDVADGVADGEGLSEAERVGAGVPTASGTEGRTNIQNTKAAISRAASDSTTISQ